MANRFSSAVLALIEKNKMLGVRSGKEHNYTRIWVVVIKRRVFVRSWNDKSTGWYRAFLENPFGTIHAGEREIRMRAKKIRAKSLLDAMERAYREKYNTPASLKWVKGFGTAKRRAATLEFVLR